MASKGPRTGAKKPVGKAPIAKVASQPVTPEPSAPAVAAATPAEPVAVDTLVEPPVEPIADVPAEPIAMVAEDAPAAIEQIEDAVEAVAEPAVEAVTEVIETTAPQMADTASKGTAIMEATMEKTQAMFAEMNERAKAAVEKNTKLVGEMTELAKGNVEALVESGKIAAKGFESIGQDAAEYSRKQFEQATATMKSLAAVKSPADFFKLQSDYVRTAFDSMVAETSKTTEAMIKLAGDAAQPVSNRVAVAMEKVKTAA
ncbi:TIGR01841 family phasin [Sphingomonas sp.]|uniref:phasin family protein n=1 Tax=Sphingomonas sp. TaxID=28214 RepID=UPI00307F9A6F